MAQLPPFNPANVPISRTREWQSTHPKQRDGSVDLAEILGQLQHIKGVAEQEMARIDSVNGISGQHFHDWLTVWQQLDKLFAMLDHERPQPNSERSST